MWRCVTHAHTRLLPAPSNETIALIKRAKAASHPMQRVLRLIPVLADEFPHLYVSGNLMCDCGNPGVLHSPDNHASLHLRLVPVITLSKRQPDAAMKCAIKSVLPADADDAVLGTCREGARWVGA